MTQRVYHVAIPDGFHPPLNGVMLQTDDRDAFDRAIFAHPDPVPEPRALYNQRTGELQSLAVNLTSPEGANYTLLYAPREAQRDAA